MTEAGVPGGVALAAPVARSNSAMSARKVHQSPELLVFVLYMALLSRSSCH